MSEKDYLILVKEMNHYMTEYQKGTPKISDVEYDTLYQKLLDYERCNGASKSSPTQIVGIKDGKTKHIQPMTSIANIYDLKQLGVWCQDKGDLVISDKLDGISLELIYKKGYLQSAILKGDGIYGKNVVGHISKIQSLSTKVDDSIISVRGELIISKHNFKDVKKKFNLTYPNECSFVASMFNMNQPSDLIRDIEFIAFELYGNYSKNDMFNILKKNNFKIPQHIKCKKVDIIKFIKKI